MIMTYWVEACILQKIALGFELMYYLLIQYIHMYSSHAHMKSIHMFLLHRLPMVANGSPTELFNTVVIKFNLKLLVWLTPP